MLTTFTTANRDVALRKIDQRIGVRLGIAETTAMPRVF